MVDKLAIDMLARMIADVGCPEHHVTSGASERYFYAVDLIDVVLETVFAAQVLVASGTFED